MTTDSQNQASRILDYEHHAPMEALRNSLRPLVPQGAKLIWRGPFRWMSDEGVLSNHFESASIEYLAGEFGYKVLFDFKHVAVVKPLNS